MKIPKRLQLDILTGAKILTRRQALKILARYPEAKGICRFCGCTASNACTEQGFFEDETCSWVDERQSVCSNPDCMFTWNIRYNSPEPPHAPRRASPSRRNLMQDQTPATIAKEAIDAITMVTRSAIGAIHDLAATDAASTQATTGIAMQAVNALDQANQQAAAQQGAQSPSSEDLDANAADQAAADATAADDGKADDSGGDSAPQSGQGMNPNDIVRARLGMAGQAAPASSSPTPNQIVSGGIAGDAPAPQSLAPGPTVGFSKNGDAGDDTSSNAAEDPGNASS